MYVLFNHGSPRSEMCDRSRFMLSCLGSLVFLLPKHLNYLASNHLTLSIPEEGYSRNVSCVLNYISTFLLDT